MKSINKLVLMLFCVSIVAVGCDDSNNLNPTLDVNNQENAISRFQDGLILTYNPAENVENIISVGVSTVSDSDRQFVLSVNDITTLEANFYEIQSLTGTIPAGSFVGSINVTTLGGDNVNLPGGTDQLVLNLDSVENATVTTGQERRAINLSVECPSVDLTQIVGSVTSFSNGLAVAFGLSSDAFGPGSVIAGPGENQVTIVGGFGLGSSDDIIINVDPTDGSITNATPEGALIFINGGTLPVPITGISGKVLTCIGRISIDVDNEIFGGSNAQWNLTVNL